MWTERQQEDSHDLERSLSTAPVLSTVHDQERFVLDLDCSDEAMGCVL